MLDAAAQEVLGVRQSAKVPGQFIDELFLVVRPAVGQGVLEMAPHGFVWVEFRGVGGKRFKVQPGEAFPGRSSGSPRCTEPLSRRTIRGPRRWRRSRRRN